MVPHPILFMLMFSRSCTSLFTLVPLLPTKANSFHSSYIIALEDVVDWGNEVFCPAADFRLWQLASPQGRGTEGDSDPMVPPERNLEFFDSEEEYLASISVIPENNKHR